MQRASLLPELAPHSKALGKAWSRIIDVVEGLLDTENARALSNATPFLFAFGHVVLAWIWLDQAALCASGLTDQDSAFQKGKVRACRYFFETELPKTGPWLDIVASVTDVAVNIPSEQF